MSNKPRRTGDVVEVSSALPEPRPGHVPDLDDPVRIRLHGHPHTYIVRVQITDTGPRLTELTITTGTPGTTAPQIGYDTLRAIPARRLAHAAAQWLLSAGGMFVDPGDTAETLARPDQRTAHGRLTDEHYQAVANAVRTAVRAGLPVRRTVAEQFHTTMPTLDRWIRTAKDRGYLDEDYIPRTKEPTGGPQQ